MTPCEEKGWKTGYWFRALSCQDYFEEGEEIYLSQDDGSRVPQFSNGKDYWYLGLGAVAPLSAGAPLMPPKGSQAHTSRNGVTIKTGDKVIITGSDNNHWKSRKGLVGFVEFLDGGARVVYEDARPWVIYDNTDIELVEEVEEDILPFIEDSEGNLYVEDVVGVMPTQQPETPLADQLEEALANLEAAQKEVDRLQAEYREAYPLINGAVATEAEHMSNPKNWKKGDVIASKEDDDDITSGECYIISREVVPGALGLMVYFYDDHGDERYRSANNYQFSHRPK